MNQKIILGVVIVILLGAIGYFALVRKSTPIAQQTPTPTPTTIQTKPPISPTPTPDKTANWKTYTNSQYGFEIKYPSSYKVFGDFNKDQSFSIFADVVSEGTGLQIQYSIKSVEELRSEINKNYTVTSDKEITFNSYKAREVIHNSEVGGPYRVVLISRNNGTFILTHWAGTYQDTLSTFKFTK